MKMIQALLLLVLLIGAFCLGFIVKEKFYAPEPIKIPWPPMQHRFMETEICWIEKGLMKRARFKSGVIYDNNQGTEIAQEIVKGQLYFFRQLDRRGKEWVHVSTIWPSGEDGVFQSIGLEKKKDKDERGNE